MIDLSKTIIPKSDQLNADDLIAGPRTITITDVRVSDGEQPVSLNFEGDNRKPYKPCKSMMRVLIKIWGSDGKQFVGKSMTIYRDETVTWGGFAVGGIRISHMSHMDKPVTMALTATKSSRKPYTVQPLKTVAVAQEPRQPSQVLLDSGLAVANRGKEEFDKWINDLDDDTKQSIRHKYKEWNAIAVSVPQDETLDDEPGL